MTADRVAQLVNTARNQAEAAARADLARLQSQAEEHGSIRAAQLFPAGRLTAERTAASARSARILRDWYTTTFTAAVRDRLGQPTPLPEAAEIDATATALRRALGSREPDQPLRAVATLHQRALADTAAAAASAYRTLTDTSQRRANRITHQPPLNPTQAAILEQWYQRCYRATIDSQLGLLQPLQAVTRAETREVIASVDTGQPRRIIGADGIPLVTAHGTAMTDIDRRLAAGHTQVVDSPTIQVRNQLLRTQVIHAWNNPGGPGEWEKNRDARRRTWAAAAGVPATTASQPWDKIEGDHQTRLIASWLDTHRRLEPQLSFAQPPADPVFRAELIIGPPRDAAAAMFNHQRPPDAAVQARQVAAAMFPNPSSSPTRAAAPPVVAPDPSWQPTSRLPGRDVQR